GAVGHRDRLLLGAEALDAQDRSEDLLAHDRRRVVHADEDRRGDVAAARLLDLALEGRLGAVLDPLRGVLLDAVALLRARQGPEARLVVEWVARHAGAGLGEDLLPERVGD